MSVPRIVGGGSVPVTTLAIEVVPNKTAKTAPTAYFKPVQFDNTDLFIVGGLSIVAMAYFALHGRGR